MMFSQFILFPPLIKMLGIARWQLLGGFLSIPGFIFVPSVKLFSWNETSLFVASVIGTTLVNNCILAVSSYENILFAVTMGNAMSHPCDVRL